MANQVKTSFGYDESRFSPSGFAPVGVVEIPVSSLRRGDRFATYDSTGKIRSLGTFVERGAASATVDEVGLGEVHWYSGAPVVRLSEEQFTAHGPIIKGEKVMAKAAKATKSKKETKAKEYSIVRYEVVASKLDGEKAKKLLNPEKTNHAAVIFRAIKTNKGLTFAELMKEAKLKGSESKNVENIVRWYINDLKKTGLIKALDETVKAESADAARAGEGTAA